MPEKFIAVVDELSHTVWLLTEFTEGIGLTVIETLAEAVPAVTQVSLEVNITDTMLPFVRVELVKVLVVLLLPWFIPFTLH